MTTSARFVTTVMIEYRLPTGAVGDFAEWKAVFDADPVGRKAHGAMGHRILQDRGDSNHFIVSIEFPTPDAADGFLSEPMLKRSWEISGARQAWVLSEPEAITY